MPDEMKKPPRRVKLRWLLWVALAALVGVGLWQLGKFLWWGITGPEPQRAPEVSLTTVFETALAAAQGGELAVPTPGTPAPTLDPVSASFVDQATAAFRSWRAARERVMERAQARYENPQLANDDGWRAGFEENLASLQETAQLLRALPTAPPDYRAVNSAALQLADQTDALVRDLRLMADGDPTAEAAVKQDLNQAEAAYREGAALLFGRP